METDTQIELIKQIEQIRSEVALIKAECEAEKRLNIKQAKTLKKLALKNKNKINAAMLAVIGGMTGVMILLIRTDLESEKGSQNIQLFMDGLFKFAAAVVVTGAGASAIALQKNSKEKIEEEVEEMDEEV